MHVLRLPSCRASSCSYAVWTSSSCASGAGLYEAPAGATSTTELRVNDLVEVYGVLEVGGEDLGMDDGDKLGCMSV